MREAWFTMMTHSSMKSMAAYLLNDAAGRIVTADQRYTRNPKCRSTAEALCDPNANGIVASRALDRLTECLERGDVYANQPYMDLMDQYGCAERNVIRFAAMSDKSFARLEALASATANGESVELSRRARSTSPDYARLTPEMFDVLNASWDGRQLIDRRSVSTYPSAGTRAELKTLVGRLAKRELICAADEVRAECGVARDVEPSLDALPSFDGAEDGRTALDTWTRWLYADSLTHTTISSVSRGDERIAAVMGDDRYADAVEGRLRMSVSSRVQELRDAGERDSVVRKETHEMLDGIVGETGAVETLEAEAQQRRVDSARSAALDKVMDYAREAAGTGDYERFLSEARSMLFGDKGATSDVTLVPALIEDFAQSRTNAEDACVVHEVEMARDADAGFDLER